MQPVLRMQGRQVSDAADGCFKSFGNGFFRAAVVSGRSAGQRLSGSVPRQNNS